MNKYFKLNLLDFCNHKFIYEKTVPQKDKIGLEGIYIDEKDLTIRSEDTVDGVEFLFNFGTFDNIVCDRQQIPVGINADKLHIVGFSYWGDTYDFIKVVYEDNVCLLKASFADLARNYKYHLSDDFWNLNINTSLRIRGTGLSGNIVYFHHSIIDLEKDKKINSIILPDNFWLHVFAITLEKEN